MTNSYSKYPYAKQAFAYFCEQSGYSSIDEFINDYGHLIDSIETYLIPNFKEGMDNLYADTIRASSKRKRRILRMAGNTPTTESSWSLTSLPKNEQVTTLIYLDDAGYFSVVLRRKPNMILPKTINVTLTFVTPGSTAEPETLLVKDVICGDVVLLKEVPLAQYANKTLSVTTDNYPYISSYNMRKTISLCGGYALNGLNKAKLESDKNIIGLTFLERVLTPEEQAELDARYSDR